MKQLMKEGRNEPRKEGMKERQYFELFFQSRVRGPVRTQRPYGDAFSVKKTSTAQTRYEIKKTKAPKNQATSPS